LGQKGNTGGQRSGRRFIQHAQPFLQHVARIERKRNPGPRYQQGGTAAPRVSLMLNPGYTPAKLSSGERQVAKPSGIKTRRLAPS
jgi:hypothetical protein